MRSTASSNTEIQRCPRSLTVRHNEITCAECELELSRLIFGNEKPNMNRLVSCLVGVCWKLYTPFCDSRSRFATYSVYTVWF